MKSITSYHNYNDHYYKRLHKYVHSQKEITRETFAKRFKIVHICNRHCKSLPNEINLKKST